MADRTNDERLDEIRRWNEQWPEPDSDLRFMLEQIDALKAEVREKDEALQESRRLHADLVKEVESMASSVFSNDRRRIENE